MAESPSTRKDVEDILRHMTDLIRSDPSYQAAEADAKDGLTVYTPTESAADAPTLTEVDLQADGDAITVTAQTRNAHPDAVHVTLSDDRLSIGLGDGALALRRELRLPAPVDETRAVATLRNGILDIVLPLRRARRGED